MSDERRKRLILDAFDLLYNELAWSYDAVSWVVSRGRWRDWQRAALPFLHGSDILEIGHGPGHLLIELTRMGRRPVGLDLSPQMSRQALRRLKRSGRSVPLVRGRAENLPFAGGCFDSVLATFPGPYIVAPETIEGIGRVLRPGGRLVIVPGSYFTERDVPAQFLEWLYAITGQRERTPSEQAGQTSDSESDGQGHGYELLVAVLGRAGFSSTVHPVDQGGSVAIVLVAEQSATASSNRQLTET